MSLYKEILFDILFGNFQTLCLSDIFYYKKIDKILPKIKDRNERFLIGYH